MLKLWMAGMLAGVLPGIRPGPARAAATPLPGPLPVAVGHGMYLVDGWLLTGADLQRLGLDDL